MNSDKAVFYYFCISIVIIMIFVITMVGITELLIPGDHEGAWRIISKCLIFAGIFAVPPVLWKLFAHEDPQEKKQRNNNAWLLVWGIAWVIVIGIASGFATAGMVKTAMWIYFASLIPAAMFFLPVAKFFNTKGLFNK